jgi:Holliday junction resolvase
LSLHRRNPRRDQTEASIVRALRRLGALVFPVSAPAFPDLVVGFQGVWCLMECKTRGENLSATQAILHRLAQSRGLPIHTVRTVADALEALGVKYDA